MTERLLGGAGTLLATLLAALSVAGALAIAVGAQPWTIGRAATAFGIVALSVTRPRWTILCLAATPWLFGNRPATPQYLWLIWATAIASLAIVARLLTGARADAARVLNGRVSLAALAYATASALSLVSLPWDQIALTIADVGVFGTMSTLARADVLDPLYSVLSVVLLLNALSVALGLAVEVRRDSRFIGPLTSALMAGAAGVVIIGLLDFYHVIDLRSLRSFDPFTNPSGVVRLQSTFGHSGWFAQYVCFTIPAVFGVFLWPIARSRQVITGLALLILGLVAIVLSYQRGGWLTYTAVLAYVLAAAWTFLVPLHGELPRRLAVRRLLGPVAAALAILAVSGGLLVTLAALSPTGTHPSISRFAQRFRTITQVSDRSAHVLAGLRLGALLPVLGGGSESFALRYQEEYLRAGGAFYARGYSPLSTMYGSAHNVFAQTFAGKGLVGLAALCWLIVGTARAAWTRLRRPPPDGRRGAIDVGARTVLGAVLGLALYGMVQEVFYVAALQLVVSLTVGLAAGLEADASRPRRITPALLAVALAVGFGAHLVQAYGVPGRLREAYVDRELSRAGARLMPPEVDADGHYFQWTGEHALITVPLHASRFAAELRNAAPFAQTVELRFDGRVIDRLALSDQSWRIVRYPIPRGRPSDPRRLEFFIRPQHEGEAASPRRGVMVRRIDWGLPGRPDEPSAR